MRFISPTWSRIVWYIARWTTRNSTSHSYRILPHPTTITPQCNWNPKVRAPCVWSRGHATHFSNPCRQSSMQCPNTNSHYSVQMEAEMPTDLWSLRHLSWILTVHSRAIVEGSSRWWTSSMEMQLERQCRVITEGTVHHTIARLARKHSREASTIGGS